MGSIWQDLRYGVRNLARNPGFALIALLVLGLGIGVNTAIFSIVNAVLYRPLPVRAPGELAYVYPADPVSAGIARRDYLALRESNDVFAGIIARSGTVARLAAEGEAALAAGELVTADYFDLLGVKRTTSKLWKSPCCTAGASTSAIPRPLPALPLFAKRWHA